MEERFVIKETTEWKVVKKYILSQLERCRSQLETIKDINQILTIQGEIASYKKLLQAEALSNMTVNGQ